MAIKGSKQSVEHIEKRADALRGYKLSPQHRKAISRALKARGGTGGGRSPNTAEELWKKVDRRGQNECWPWTGYVSESGYGRTWIKGKGYYAHRVIFSLCKPLSLEAPDSTFSNGFLLHTCDSRSCCNPAHMFIGTNADNVADKVSKKRQKKWGGGINSPRAMFSADEVRNIRLLKRSGLTSKAISEIYGCSISPIGFIVTGRSYKDVKDD